MKGRCVYVLRGARYYIGSTNDLQRRLKEHTNKGYSAKRIGVLKCIGYIECPDRQSARDLEKQIKKSCHPERYIDCPDFKHYDI